MSKTPSPKNNENLLVETSTRKWIFFFFFPPSIEMTRSVTVLRRFCLDPEKKPHTIAYTERRNRWQDITNASFPSLTKDININDPINDLTVTVDTTSPLLLGVHHKFCGFFVLIILVWMIPRTTRSAIHGSCTK